LGTHAKYSGEDAGREGEDAHGGGENAQTPPIIPELPQSSTETEQRPLAGHKSLAVKSRHQAAGADSATMQIDTQHEATIIQLFLTLQNELAVRGCALVTQVHLCCIDPQDLG